MRCRGGAFGTIYRDRNRITLKQPFIEKERGGCATGLKTCAIPVRSDSREIDSITETKGLVERSSGRRKALARGHKDR